MEGYEDRIIEYVFTDETVDRYGDVVIAKGADLKNYMTNPVVLTFHDYHQFPVGRALKVWIDKDERAVKGYVLFLDNRVDDTGLSETAFKFAKAGAMNTGSIGFLPIDWRMATEDDIKDRNMPKYGAVYEKWELLEFTLCPVPANPSARRKMVERGFSNPDELILLFSKLEKQVKFILSQKNGGEKQQNNDIIKSESTVTLNGESIVKYFELKNKSTEDILKNNDLIIEKIDVLNHNVNAIITALNCLNISIDLLSEKINENGVNCSVENPMSDESRKINAEKIFNQINDVSKAIKDLEV